MKCGIYSRCSTRDRGQDVENQLSQLREFCGKQGWEIYREYSDYESGAKADRPQFKLMFEDASKRRFDLCLFWALDRLSREGTLPTLRYLETLTGYGIQWRSFQEQFFDSCGPFRDAVVSIMATLARQEKLRIGERTRAGLQMARARGARIGRPRATVDVAAIGQLRSAGYSWDSIGERLNLSRETVRKAASAA